MTSTCVLFFLLSNWVLSQFKLIFLFSASRCLSYLKDFGLLLASLTNLSKALSTAWSSNLRTKFLFFLGTLNTSHHLRLKIVLVLLEKFKEKFFSSSKPHSINSCSSLEYIKHWFELVTFRYVYFYITNTFHFYKASISKNISLLKDIWFKHPLSTT